MTGNCSEAGQLGFGKEAGGRISKLFCKKDEIISAAFLALRVYAFVTFIFPLVLSGSASARSIFQLDVKIEGGFTASREFDDAEDFIQQLDNQGLEELVPEYDDTLAVDAELDVRGLQAFASYPKNSNELSFQVPCSRTNLTFRGSTRDDSKNQLLDFLKGNKFLEGNSSSVTDIARCLVSETPVDPVAGNPNSLMASMAASDYSVGTTTDAGRENLFAVRPEYFYSSAEGFGTNAISLPLNYVITIPNPDRPPYAIIFDLPLRYLNIEGGDVVDGSFAVGFRAPLVNLNQWAWAITTTGRAGIVGSLNVGASQAVYSGSITSKLDYYYEDLRISLNNMFGYYTSGSFGGDFGVNYDLDNGIIRTGFAAEGSLNYQLFDQPISWEFQFVDTRIVGDDWFNSWYDEAVLTFGTRHRPARMTWQDLRVGFSYTFASDFNRIQLLLNYRF